jgi:single-strand DNA-binding protein
MGDYTTEKGEIKLNKVILMGRLTKNPELRYTANNTPVASFTLAVERKFIRQGEEKQSDFISIIAWSKQAEFCNKYLGKGYKVVVVGRIQTRTWDDTEGKKHYVTEVVAEEFHFAEAKKAKVDDDGGAGEGFYPFPDPNDDELPF